MPLQEPLDPVEARVLGVLVEKELTTPDQYPLSLNALTSGCNQKSNRNPEMSLSSGQVSSAVDRLRLQQLAGETRSTGARVTKYRHTAREKLGLEDAAVAVVAELLLRGPQTAGEIRGRASRMSAIPDLVTLDGILRLLIDRGHAARVAPLQGSRAVRYGQRLCPDVKGDAEILGPAPDAVVSRAAADEPVASAPAPSAPAPAAPAPAAPFTGPGGTPVSRDAGVPLSVGLASAHASADIVARVHDLEDEVKDLKAKLLLLADRLKIPIHDA